MATILIIDDDDAFRDGLAETIQDLGYAPLEARSGEEAIERLREEASPDCIFLDFRLPGADGLSVLETLRGTAGLQDVPVVMLTAYATSDNTIGAMRLGAFEHLTKPVGRDEIAALLARIPEHDSDLPGGGGRVFLLLVAPACRGAALPDHLLSPDVPVG